MLCTHQVGRIESFDEPIVDWRQEVAGAVRLTLAAPQPRRRSIHNKQMIDEGTPDIVVAFAGGRRTANMVKQAKSVGVEVVEV